MTTRVVALWLLLAAGCASGSSRSGDGTSHASGGETASGVDAGIVLTRVRADLTCTEAIPSGERDCVAQGCQWSAPLFCSGIQLPPEEIRADATRPCVCVCQDDLMRCMSQP